MMTLLHDFTIRIAMVLIRWRRRRLELDLERRGWPPDRAASKMLDRLLGAEESLGG